MLGTSMMLPSFIVEFRFYSAPLAAVLVILGVVLQRWRPGGEDDPPTLWVPSWKFAWYICLCYVILGFILGLLLGKQAEHPLLLELLLWIAYSGVWLGGLLVVLSVWLRTLRLASKFRRLHLYSLPTMTATVSLGFAFWLHAEGAAGVLRGVIFMNAIPSLLLVVNGLFLAISLIGRRSRLLNEGKADKFIAELKLWLEVRLPSTLRVPIAPEETLRREMQLEMQKWDLKNIQENWDLYDLDRGFRWTFRKEMGGGQWASDYSVLPFDPAQGLGQAEIVLVVARIHRAKTKMTSAVLKRIMYRNIDRLNGAIEGRDTSNSAMTPQPSGPIVHCDVIEEISEMATADDLLGMIKAAARRLSSREVHGPITIIVRALSARGEGEKKMLANWSSADVRRLLGYIVLDEELALHKPTIVLELDMDAADPLFTEVPYFLNAYLEGSRALIHRMNEVHRTLLRLLPIEEGSNRFARGLDITYGPTWALRLFTTEIDSVLDREPADFPE